MFFLQSCNSGAGSKKEIAGSDSANTDMSAKAVLETYPAKTVFTPAGKPLVTKAGAPTEFIANANVKKAEALTTFPVGANIKKITPGTDTFAVLKAVPITPTLSLCKQPVPVKAQPPRFKDASITDIQYLDVDQGMSSSMIKCIISDRTGNLWIGTKGAGVSRYDGQSFLHFTEKNGLNNNTVLTIYQDKKGNIWFGTEGGGVCCYDGKNFLSITEDEGLGNNTVLAICEDKNGNMWFGTNGGGVSKYDPTAKTITSFTEKEGLNNNLVRCIIQDKDGNMWFGTTGSGACKFDGTSFYYYGEAEGFDSSIIHTMYQDKEGLIYFGTEDGGVNIFDGKAFKYITAVRGLSSNCIVSLHEDKFGNLWIGTYDSGLCKYDGNSITVYSTKEGLTNNYILSVCEDLAGNIWMATYGGGVCRFNYNSFSHYTEKEGMGTNTVRSITEDAQGNLAFATFGDGIIYYNGSSFKHYTDKQGLPSNRFKASVSDGNYTWFGTEENGAVRFDGKTFETFTDNQGLSGNYITCMYKDKDANIWFGTDEAGVCRYDGSQFMTFSNKGLSDGIITAIIQDKSGNMWFGTDGSGVCCYDGKSVKWYDANVGLASNNVTCLFEDNEGNIWFGSENQGLTKLSAESINSSNPDFTYFSLKENLSSNAIRSIKQDQSGNIWVATALGLNYIAFSKEGYNIHTYTSADGLKANDFLSNSVHIDKKGIIWWGNGKALTNLDLNNYKFPQSTPSINLNSIELEKTFVDFYALEDSLQLETAIVVGEKDKKDLRTAKFKGVERFNNYPKNLVLPYNINQIEFLFSAIDWAGANKIKYQYMLSGADEDWSPVTPENRALYTNLSSGEHVFKVKAVGVSGKWSDVFEYTFKVSPPWYKTMVAYVLYVALFFFIVIGFNNLRTRQLKLRQQQLEQTVADRTAEVVEQKELIEEKQKEIVDSINYAKRIQRALLASDHLLDDNLKKYFLFFQPKDIVSGDFYWASAMANGNFALVTADSTGHGVPGAMMSMLNISCLNEAINERKFVNPAQILNHVRERIIQSLSRDGSLEGGKDGMDCSLVVFDFKNKKLTYSAANNSVWIIRRSENAVHPNGYELIDLKADRMPVGKHEKDGVSFSEHTVDLMEGDFIYTLTDGFADQFGGVKGKKYTSRRLKDLLVNSATKSLEDQKEILGNAIDKWKGTLEQVDDICVIGIKI